MLPTVCALGVLHMLDILSTSSLVLWRGDVFFAYLFKFVLELGKRSLMLHWLFMHRISYFRETHVPLAHLV